MNKRQLKLFYYEWLLQLQERAKYIRGKRLKYNLSMQRQLKKDLNIE